MFDVDAIQRSVEGSLAVEEIRPSNMAKSINKKYLRGEITSDDAIKKIKAHWLRLIKLEPEAVNKMAVRMYLSGFPKGNICLKLKIDMVYLDGLIVNISGNVKDTATYMYFLGYSKEKICSDLYIKKYILNQWIEKVYKRNKNISVREKPRIQSGFTPWVSQILDKQMKVMGLLR